MPVKYLSPNTILEFALRMLLYGKVSQPGAIGPLRVPLDVNQRNTSARLIYDIRSTVHWMLTRGAQAQNLFTIYGPLDVNQRTTTTIFIYDIRSTVHWMLTRGPQLQYLLTIYGLLSTGC